MAKLSRLVPLRVEPFDQFLRRQRQFHVYGPPTWMTTQLIESGVMLRAERIAPNAMVWEGHQLLHDTGLENAPEVASPAIDHSTFATAASSASMSAPTSVPSSDPLR